MKASAIRRRNTETRGALRLILIKEYPKLDSDVLKKFKVVALDIERGSFLIKYLI